MLEYSDKIGLNARCNDGVTAVMTACINGHKFKLGKKVHGWGKPKNLPKTFILF